MIDTITLNIYILIPNIMKLCIYILNASTYFMQTYPMCLFMPSFRIWMQFWLFLTPLLSFLNQGNPNFIKRKIWFTKKSLRSKNSLKSLNGSLLKVQHEINFYLNGISENFSRALKLIIQKYWYSKYRKLRSLVFS